MYINPSYLRKKCVLHELKRLLNGSKMYFLWQNPWPRPRILPIKLNLSIGDQTTSTRANARQIPTQGTNTSHTAVIFLYEAVPISGIFTPHWILMVCCQGIISSKSENTFLYSHVLSVKWIATMMTSSNGNIFRVTGPLCGEFTGDRWIDLFNNKFSPSG